MTGYVLFGIAMARTPSLPRLAGILVAVGAPTHLLGFGVAQLVSPSLWPIAVVGSVILGAGLAWPGYRLWHTRRRLRSISRRHEGMAIGTGPVDRVPRAGHVLEPVPPRRAVGPSACASGHPVPAPGAAASSPHRPASALGREPHDLAPASTR